MVPLATRGLFSPLATFSWDARAPASASRTKSGYLWWSARERGVGRGDGKGVASRITSSAARAHKSGGMSDGICTRVLRNAMAAHR